MTTVMMMMMKMFQSTTGSDHCQLDCCKSGTHSLLIKTNSVWHVVHQLLVTVVLKSGVLFSFACACYCDKCIYFHSNCISLCAFQIFSLRNVPLLEPKNKPDVQFQCTFGRMCLERIVSVHSRGFHSLQFQPFWHFLLQSVNIIKAIRICSIIWIWGCIRCVCRNVS